MKTEVKRIGIFSAVKTMFLVGGVAGFLMGLLQWFFLMMLQRAGDALPGGMYGFDQPGMSELLDAGIGALGLILPFFGGFAGAIGGVFMAVILGGVYNIAARLWGGLEVETREVESPAAPVSLAHPSAPGQATPLPRADAMTQVPTPQTRPDSERRPPAMYE
jgi:hypothetical protein